MAHKYYENFDLTEKNIFLCHLQKKNVSKIEFAENCYAIMLSMNYDIKFIYFQTERIKK